MTSKKRMQVEGHSERREAESFLRYELSLVFLKNNSYIRK